MKIPIEDKSKFHLHSMITINMIMEGVMSETSLSITEKIKFSEILTGAFHANRQELLKIQSEIETLQPITNICNINFKEN